MAQSTPFLSSPYYGTTSKNQDYSSAHPAIDFNLVYVPVLAAGNGTVDFVGWWNDNCHQSGTLPNDDNNCGFGLYARINYGNNYRSYYAHLSTVAFAKGTTSASVYQGQTLGNSGHTGWSTGPHLHFQTQNFVNNAWNNVDPSTLWSDGQYANPSRPIPQPLDGQKTIQVADTTNNSGGFSKGDGGPFNNSCINNCGGWTHDAANFYLTNVNGSTADSWAKWQPSIASGGGIYEIYVYVPTSSQSKSWQAPYTIRDVSSTTIGSAVVDQAGLSNQWVSIGTYLLTNGAYIFTTDATGEGQGTHCGSGAYCQLAADDVKFVRRGTTYVPDIRCGNGWSSSIKVFNHGGVAKMLFKFLNSAGQAVASTFSVSNIAAHRTYTPVCLDSSVTSMVIDSDQDISVAVRHEATGKASRDNAFRPATGANSFEQTANVLYGPSFYKNIFGGLYSTVYIQNISSNYSFPQVVFLGRTNYGTYVTNNPSLPPGGVWVVNTTPINNESSWVGSIKVNSSPYPVAIKVIHENTSGVFARSYSGSAGGASVIYAPSAYKNAFGNNTGIVVQNLSASQTTNVTLWYCDRTVASLSNCYSEVINNLDSERAAGINLATSTVIAPASWTGTIKAQSSNGVSLAMSVNNSNSVGSLDYNASAPGGQIAYLPGARRNVTGNANNYTSYIVRNVAGSHVDIVALFFAASDGSLTWKQSSFGLDAEQAAGYSQKDHPNLPSGWQGSIVLVSTGPILAVMQENTATSFDGNNATNR